MQQDAGYLPEPEKVSLSCALRTALYRSPLFSIGNMKKGFTKLTGGVKKVSEATVVAVGKVVPDRLRDDWESRMEDAHKKGFLTEQALEEIRKEGEKKVEDLFPPAKEFEGLDEEVTKRWYDWDNKSWETGKCTVAIAKEQFAEGGMRVAHFMLVKNPGKEPERWVAKRQKEDPDDETVYDADVIMQAACQAIAKAFNARVGPADSVEFVDCHTIKTASGTWWACEPYLQGKYIKYNNNYGYVDKRARNTPQAFTHFRSFACCHGSCPFLVGSSARWLSWFVTSVSLPSFVSHIWLLGNRESGRNRVAHGVSSRNGFISLVGGFKGASPQ